MYQKMFKQLKKIIKKEWNIDYIDIKLTDPILQLAERIGMKYENCSLPELYSKWILREDLKYVGWISFYLVSEFSELYTDKIIQAKTVQELFDACIKLKGDSNEV